MLDVVTCRQTALIIYDCKLGHKEAGDSEAEAQRDALARALYSGLFDHLVKSINDAGVTKVDGEAEPVPIGLLDIFGFEDMSGVLSSLKRLCVV